MGFVVPNRGRGRRGVRLLRPWRRRDRRCQQELHQDRRPGDRPLCAGLLRLRLEEVGRDHHFSSASEHAPHPIGVSRGSRRVRRLPSVRVRRQDRRARTRGTGRGVPAERPIPGRRGMGPPAARDAGGNHPQEAPLLRHRRLRSGPERRHGHAHQHDHADVFLRDFWNAATRGGDRAHQEVDREDLRQARPGGRAPKLRGGRSGAGCTCTKSACRTRSALVTAGRRSCPSGRPISSRRSRPSCSPEKATCFR